MSLLEASRENLLSCPFRLLELTALVGSWPSTTLTSASVVISPTLPLPWGLLLMIVLVHPDNSG